MYLAFLSDEWEATELHSIGFEKIQELEASNSDFNCQHLFKKCVAANDIIKLPRTTRCPRVIIFVKWEVRYNLWNRLELSVIKSLNVLTTIILFSIFQNNDPFTSTSKPIFHKTFSIPGHTKFIEVLYNLIRHWRRTKEYLSDFESPLYNSLIFAKRD